MDMNDIKKLIIEKYSDELFLRVKEFCYGEIINGKINNIFPFLIKSVNVFKVEGDIIYFSVYMKATVKVENDYNTYLKRFEFTAICEILLTTENSSFRINSLFPENLSCGKGIMSSMLVPIIYKDDLDVIAEEILEKYYPEALETPVAINPNTMAERMGIEIKTAKLSENDNIFGQMCFESCSYINYESNRTETARRKTMLIDPNCFLMRGYGFFNNTIIHECVHWEKHRFYFDLQRQFNSENCFIKCGSENMGENYKWMEKQANQLAPRILMPRKTVIKFVNTFIFENRDYFSGENSIELFEKIITEVAQLYNVSKQSAKIRLQELGIKEAEEIFNFNNGRYVIAHSFDRNAIKNGETYTINLNDVLDEYENNEKFRSIIRSGNFIYIDCHFCIYDKKYVNEEGRLTNYALTHIDECCLKFKVRKINEEIHYKEGTLFRDDLVERLIKATYSEEAQNEELRMRAKKLSEEAEICSEIIRQLPGTFSDTLVKLMDMYDITEEQLEEQSTVNQKTIQRMRTDINYIPKCKTLVAVCLGMHLHPELSKNLINKSPIKINTSSKEGIMYDLLLQSSWKKNIYEINEELKFAGVKNFISNKLG